MGLTLRHVIAPPRPITSMQVDPHELNARSATASAQWLDISDPTYGFTVTARDAPLAPVVATNPGIVARKDRLPDPQTGGCRA